MSARAPRLADYSESALEAAAGACVAYFVFSKPASNAFYSLAEAQCAIEDFFDCPASLPCCQKLAGAGGAERMRRHRASLAHIAGQRGAPKGAVLAVRRALKAFCLADPAQAMLEGVLIPRLLAEREAELIRGESLSRSTPRASKRPAPRL